MSNATAKVIVGVALALLVALGVQDCSAQRENNRNLNPQIFDAFRRIENQVEAKYRGLLDAGRDPELYMSVRELWVYRETYRSLRAATSVPGGDSVSAQEYYWQLYEREFPLPPLYKPGYEEKRSWWTFWK